MSTQDIQQVTEIAAQLQDQYGIRFDVDGVRDSVEQIVRQHGLNLRESEVCKACDSVLEQQDARFPIHAGLIVVSRLGEIDSDEHDNERHTGPDAIGVLVERDEPNLQWSAVFTNGTSVWITDTELADVSSYEIRRERHLNFLAEVPGSRDESSLVMTGSPDCAPGVSYWLALEAAEGPGPRTVDISYSLSADEDEFAGIVKGMLRHEGDPHDLLSHLLANKRAILDEVYAAMVATAPKSAPAHQSDRKPVNPRVEAIMAADAHTNNVGLLTYTEAMNGMMGARVALLAMIARPSSTVIDAQARSAAMDAVYGTLMPHEQRAVVEAAKAIIAKNKVALVEAGKTIDADLEVATRDHRKALQVFGFSLLTEAAVTCGTLRDSFERAAAIRKAPGMQATGAQPGRRETPPISQQARRPRL